MKYRAGLILLLLFLTCLPKANAQVEVKGILCPEKFGAVGDGKHDDTQAIQLTIDSLAKLGGGTLRLGSGTYLVSSIKLGPKVSIVGNGNGATIIRQVAGQKLDCLIVKDIAAALKIADLTVLGNDVNRGIYFERSGGFGENHPYLYSNTSQWDKSQGYKWTTIDNICIYHFDVGLYVQQAGFDINICNSTFSHNVNGVIMRCTDSSLNNCYITNNKKNGLTVFGSNNKISNVKSIFNGKGWDSEYGAIVVNGSRCQLINCETQDNYGKGFIINGKYNVLSNCISNTDGYGKNAYRYDSDIQACGFQINERYNSFSNCVVTNYNEKYGAVYHSPVIVADSVSYCYSDIFNDIKVLIGKDKLLFNEPFKNVQTLCSKNIIRTENKTRIDGGDYFVSRSLKSNIINAISCGLSSLNVLVDFRCEEERGNIVSVVANDDLTISVVNKSLCVFWKGLQKTELVLDQDVVMNQDDLRLIFSCANLDGKLVVFLLCYEKTKSRGWIKKEVRQETDIPAFVMKTANIKIGDTGVAIKRLAISNSPMSESVYLPYSNTNVIYDGSVVYVDADSYM